MATRIPVALCLSVFLPAFAAAQGTISSFFTFSGAGSAGLAIDPQGVVYLTDSANARVRKISGGTLTIIAGNGTFQTYTGDGGPALSAGLNINSSGISGVAVDSAGNVYFSDSANMVVRKITTATGIITTYAGNGTGAGTSFGTFTGDGSLATAAGLNNPGDLAIDSNGNLYICDTDNARIRKVTPDGIITTVAGNGNVVAGGDGGAATSAAVPSPAGIAVDAQGNLYITSSRRVRKVTAATGIITTVAGTGANGYTGDGGQATAATLTSPLGIAVDQFGNVYFTDRSSGGRIRKVDAAGIITTIAGITGNASTPLGDGGPATNAYFDNPTDLMIDSTGNLYVATQGSSNGRIRKIAASGAGFIASPASLTFSSVTGGTAPPSQTVSITSSSGVLGYTASASSTGNWLSVGAPASGNTPGTITVSVNSASLGSGSYQGTITLTPSGTGNSPLPISVTLNVSGAGSPVINSGQIYNASGYQAKLAPDTVFVIFGSNMGPASIQVASAPNYPLSLGGTSATFTPAAGGASISVKMVYTLAGQIAGLLPSSITPGTYAVRVIYNGLTSAPQNVTVVGRSFGIAAANSGGNGTAQATIGNVNGGISLTRFTSGSVSFNGYTWTLTPAHPGDTIVLWGTGGGADSANDAGGTSGDQTTAGNFKVNLGSRQVTPLYAGASQGYPGLWQINFVIPPDMSTDCFASVQVSAGGELSNTVVIPIAAAGQTTCVDPTMPASVMSKLDAGQQIVFAAFAIAKLTQTAPAVATQETASGAVFSYTPAQWITLNSGPLFGACRVYDRTYPVGSFDPGSPSKSLDAGSKLPLSGPNLPAGFGLGSISSTFGPAYVGSVTTGTLTGGTYNLSGPGGSQMGTFSASTVFPSSFSVTNFDNITSIDRSKALTLNWTGSNFDQVAILVNSAVTANGLQHITTLNCNVPGAAGTYTIPAAALALLSPVAATGSAFGGLSVQATSAPGKFTASLTSGGAIDYGSFGANLGYSKNLAIQ